MDAADPAMGESAGRGRRLRAFRLGPAKSRSRTLPNYEMPGFDGIGANEFIVDVTHPDTVDFISAGDTPHIWELNIWYHTLNAGFRTRISGETDFPCIYDDRVGLARSYAKVDGTLTYRKWIDAVQAGRSYVSDGKSHLMDFAVNGVEGGTRDSEIQLDRPGRVKVTLKAAANLDGDAERRHSQCRRTRPSRTGISSAPGSASARGAGRDRRQRRGRRDRSRSSPTAASAT